jgi:hypothetical protein
MRRELSMYLIANMATCDVMIGIYTILISKHNLFLEALQQIENSDGRIYVKHCQGSTILLTVGEIVSMTTALLLTIEKYTCIVHCMKPDVRLKKKHALIVLLIAWIASFLFAISPYFGFISLKYSPSFLCTMPINEGKQPTFIIYPLSIMLVNYLLMLPMYLRIFLFVRRSSSAMGLHRNAALAKQVFIMIGSNFFFFAVPMILLVVNVFLFEGHVETVLDRPIQDHIVYVWLPIMFLGINSVLNPFLYAFRRKKFKREFINCACFGGHLSERLRRAFSALKSSRMSSSASKVELYEVGTDQRRPHFNSQIPAVEQKVVVLCNVTPNGHQRTENNGYELVTCSSPQTMVLGGQTTFLYEKE